MLKKPEILIYKLADAGWLRWMSDEHYLRLIYRIRAGKKLNINHPQTFNEKLHWLKIHDHCEAYVPLVDKYAVKSIIKDMFGEQYVIPLIGVYKRAEDIPWSDLPDQFILKCTHASSAHIICTDKSTLHIANSTKQLNTWLKKNWSWRSRNWAIGQVPPQIICEEYMVDESNEQLKDYKIFCFDGEPAFIQVDMDRFKKHKRNVYDLSWNLLDVWITHPTVTNIAIERPQKLDKMIEIARKLSTGYPHIRVDFYVIQDRAYFGEFTLFHESGIGNFQPASFERQMSEKLKLTINN